MCIRDRSNTLCNITFSEAPNNISDFYLLSPSSSSSLLLSVAVVVVVVVLVVVIVVVVVVVVVWWRLLLLLLLLLPIAVGVVFSDQGTLQKLHLLMKLTTTSHEVFADQEFPQNFATQEILQ